MRYRVADDARPQVMLLVVAAGVSVALWLLSWLVPLAVVVVFPLQLFATFIHEGGHVLASLLVGGAVYSLTVSPDTSGAVLSTSDGGWLSGLLISSAGYVGTTMFSVVLLLWLRFKRSSRGALYASAIVVAGLTVVFGLLAPVLNAFAGPVTFGSMVFTVIAGAVLAGGLYALARYASAGWVDFALAFLALQCLLNAVFSLRDLFRISALGNAHSDAQNLEQATGVPAIVWATLWIVVSIAIIAIGARFYAVARDRAPAASAAPPSRRI